MSSLFEIDGENLDLGYKNLREGKFPAERAMCLVPNKMWGAYEPYADPDFRDGFARDRPLLGVVSWFLTARRGEKVAAHQRKVHQR